MAACTLVSAALTGNWGKEGGRSQGRPVGGDCKYGEEGFRLIADTIITLSPEFTKTTIAVMIIVRQLQDDFYSPPQTLSSPCSGGRCQPSAKQIW